MRKTSRRSMGLVLGAAVAAASACAHAPGAAQRRPPADSGPRQDEADSGRQQDEKVLVTGSRIPQRLDARTGLPATASPVRIYSRRDLSRTGRPETSDALRQLDPSIP